MKNPKIQQQSPAQQVARLLKDYRTAYKLSQAELAKRAGTTQSEISRLERGLGNPRLSTLDTLAKVFKAKLALNFRD